ncbi:hypothetical protein FB451DRAFT_204238 [Mycena latifolia]|nr:hypothetical protein FB451DRAFT_204238 [Mycena latifolia]
MTRNSASLAQIFVLITALSPAVSAFLLLLCIFLRRAHYGDQEYFSQASVASRYSVFRLAGCFILLLLSGVTLRKGNVEDRLVRLSLLTSYRFTCTLAFCQYWSYPQDNISTPRNPSFFVFHLICVS